MRGTIRWSVLGACLIFLSPWQGAVNGQRAEEGGPARGIVTRALDLMGGQAVREIATVRLDMMTQWQRTSYRDVPWTDRPSFEPHVDVRDYGLPAWRNTRDFGARKIRNVIRDSVAVTDAGDGFRPLSVAYVDERDELFVYTPDRLILLLNDAADLRTAPDTLIGGEPHARVLATLHTGRGPLRVMTAFHKATGLPALLRFRQGHPNDFGLVPFGDMWVEVWYSGWRSFGEVAIPTQWDIQRAGAPYKRMTVLNAVFNPELAADSFAIAPELRERFLSDRRPMHDVPIDSITEVAPGLLQIHGFGNPRGILRVGGGTVLLEAGHAPLNLERTVAELARRGIPEPSMALLATARTGNGAVVELVRNRVPVVTSPAAATFLGVTLANAGEASTGLTVVRQGRWLDGARRHVRVEPVGLPDVPESMLIFVPELGWVYAPDAITALDTRMILERARALGWEVRAIGTARTLWTEVAATGG